ncbi:MAG: response regulator [Thermoanaerobaculia bacterium]
MVRSKPLVVIAENDEGYRQTVLEFLQAEGYLAIGASNGAEALQKIRSGKRPDLILLDLEMPILSGWEFLAVREGDPMLLMIPVIVLSGRDNPGLEIGPNAFLAKPVEPAKLKRLIEQILDETNPDPERLPRSTEPWSVDEKRPNILRNSFGRVVAFVASEREARRVAAVVNGTARLSTEALEQGIIDKGLECLYELSRYDTDEKYRKEVETGSGIAPLLNRRDEIARMLHFEPPT